MKSDFPLSSAKIKALKADLAKLADVDYMKKELNRITAEIKKFDVHLKLSPQAKKRLKMLEKRFHQLKVRMLALQKHVDTEVDKITALLKKSAAEATATWHSVRASSKRKAKTSTRKTKTSSKKAASRKSRG